MSTDKRLKKGDDIERKKLFVAFKKLLASFVNEAPKHSTKSGSHIDIVAYSPSATPFIYYYSIFKSIKVFLNYAKTFYLKGVIYLIAFRKGFIYFFLSYLVLIKRNDQLVYD